MSAIPVINNLYEAKALLEMTRGEKFDKLKTFSTIANALAMHEKLMLHGIRYRPNYKIAIAFYVCPKARSQYYKLEMRSHDHLKVAIFA
jgi:hypothetical protein